MDWVYIIGLLIGTPAAWETMKWILWGKRREYLQVSDEQHVKDLERASQAQDRLEKRIKEQETERKNLIKENMELTGALLRQQIQNERLNEIEKAWKEDRQQMDAEIARLRILVERCDENHHGEGRDGT